MACSINRSGDGGPPGPPPPGPPPPGPIRPSRAPGPVRPSRGPPGPRLSRTPPGRSNEPPRSGGPSGGSGGWATETVTTEAAITAMAVTLAIPSMRLIGGSLKRGGSFLKQICLITFNGTCRHRLRSARRGPVFSRSTGQTPHESALLQILVRPGTEEIAPLHAGRILPHHLGRAANDPRRAMTAAAIP